MKKLLAALLRLAPARDAASAETAGPGRAGAGQFGGAVWERLRSDGRQRLDDTCCLVRSDENLTMEFVAGENLALDSIRLYSPNEANWSSSPSSPSRRARPCPCRRT